MVGGHVLEVQRPNAYPPLWLVGVVQSTDNNTYHPSGAYAGRKYPG